MKADQAPNQNRYLIDPRITSTDKRSLAVLALDKTIRTNPNVALEILTKNCQAGTTARYSPDTPHHQFTEALGSALEHTHNGVGLFNLADDDSFNAITSDETFRDLSKKRHENPESEELAHRAACAGLRIYIKQLNPVDALQ